MLPDHLPFLLDHCLVGLYALSGEKIVWLNARAAELVGCRPEEMVGGSFLEFVYPPDLSLLRAAETAGPYVIRAVRRDGQLVHLEVHQRSLEKDGQRLISGAVVDVTARVTAESAERDKLLHDAFHDLLTGLPNRALFLDRLEHRLALEKRRHKTSFSVLVLDIDRFKVINDSLGHVRGDELLIEVARRLQSCLRPGDSVARLSGDEFTILLEDVATAADARKVADRLREELRVPFWLGALEVFSGASIGIAHGSATYAHPEDILRDADTALYRAKAQGRGRCVEFDASMHDRAVELLQLETALRRALERNEFRLHYQPVVSLTSGQITGAEALLRWNHPERGLVPPMEFIPLAEETGLIRPIGRWVLAEACRQVRAWQLQHPSSPPLMVSVNLSTSEFRHPGLVDDVAAALRETGLAPCSLRLEITESVALDDVDAAVAVLTALKGLGVRLALDDFGTGYSSLGYLQRLPVDMVKIDRSFLSGADAGPRTLAIVRAIASLAHALGMDATAEGIETAEQLAWAREARCERGQGYYFSRPLPAAAMGRLLAGGLAPPHPPAAETPA